MTLRSTASDSHTTSDSHTNTNSDSHSVSDLIDLMRLCGGQMGQTGQTGQMGREGTCEVYRIENVGDVVPVSI